VLVSASAALASAGINSWTPAAAARRPAAGRVRVAVDGVTVATIDLHASAAKHRRVVWAHTFTAAGSHTVTLTNLTAGKQATVDAFVVAG
jgi:hypothetical protein